MGPKTIATVIRDFEGDRPALETAAAIADVNSGHLDVICLGIDRIELGSGFAGANAVALQESFEAARQEALDSEENVRSVLRTATFGWETEALTVQLGAIGNTVSARTQLSDLIVLGKPYGQGRKPEDVAIVEAALFGTRTPVLICPERQAGPLKAKKIAVAWNESAEALAAIRGALPFLVASDEVDIVIIDPSPHGSERSDPGGYLAEVLARHGVKAKISVLAQTMPRVSDVLIRHLDEQGSELLVMGAYGHSRFREAILGGATRNMLEQAKLPVLMAH